MLNSSLKYGIIYMFLVDFYKYFLLQIQIKIYIISWIPKLDLDRLKIQNLLLNRSPWIENIRIIGRRRQKLNQNGKIGSKRWVGFGRRLPIQLNQPGPIHFNRSFFVATAPAFTNTVLPLVDSSPTSLVSLQQSCKSFYGQMSARMLGFEGGELWDLP